MPAKKYHIHLTPGQRKQLYRLIKTGDAKARKITRAHILLLSDQGLKDGAIVSALQTSLATVGRVRQRFLTEGLAAALEERPRRGKPPTLTGKLEARITALACSDAPEGYEKWSLRLLADKVVELEWVESISHEAIRKLLKKTL